jgi:hypothetical protein
MHAVLFRRALRRDAPRCGERDRTVYPLYLTGPCLSEAKGAFTEHLGEAGSITPRLVHSRRLEMLRWRIHGLRDWLTRKALKEI